jgi:hypothetical protein
MIFDRERLTHALAKIGFIATKSRYYKHPECSHLFLEFPRGPVEIGEQYPVVPDEVTVEGRRLRILSPTDSVKDRLAGYIHWKSRSYFDQALLICRQQMRVNLNDIKKWCMKEGGMEAYQEMVDALSQDSSP